MRVLEEVTVYADFAADEYLAQLTTHLRGSTRGHAAALNKLEEVRLALARNLARALVVGFDNPF